MDNEKLCEDVLKISKKIRYVGIYNEGEFHHQMREGLKSYLTHEETEIALSQAIYRWSTRKKIASKIGNPIFAMARYEKINRITIPIGRAGLILISTEPDQEIYPIVEKTLALT